MSPFRRGAFAIRAAAGEMDVYEQLEEMGLRIGKLGSKGWLAHQCPNSDEHSHGDAKMSAQSHVESGWCKCQTCGYKTRWPGFHGPIDGYSPSGSLNGQMPDPVLPERATDGEPWEAAPSLKSRWVYRDWNSNTIGGVKRLETDDGKSFRPFYWNADGEEVTGAPLHGFSLYREPEVIKAVKEGATIFITEGEKDADALLDLGLVATTNQGGAGNTASWEGHAHRLKGADVMIVADFNKAGLKHALRVQEYLDGVADSVEILLPAIGKDVSDHLHNGLGLDDLIPYESFPSANPKGSMKGGNDWAWYTGADIPEMVVVEWRAYPFLARGARTLMVADPKAGKTTYLLAMSDAIIGGEDFLGQPTIKGPVIYLTEQTQATFFQQFPPGLRGNADFHYLPYPANFGRDWPEFTAQAVERCQQVGAEVLIIDTAQKFSQLEDERENTAGAVEGILAQLDLAQSLGIDVVVAKHERKAGGRLAKAAAGSYVWGAWPDILIGVREVEGNPHHRRVENKGRVEDAQGVWTIEYVREGRSLNMLGDHASVSQVTARDKIIECMQQAPEREWDRSGIIAITELDEKAVDSALARHPDVFEKARRGVYKLSETWLQQTA